MGASYRTHLRMTDLRVVGAPEVPFGDQRIGRGAWEGLGRVGRFWQGVVGAP
jgi:hypothetical protein